MFRCKQTLLSLSGWQDLDVLPNALLFSLSRVGSCQLAVAGVRVLSRSLPAGLAV